MFLSDFCTFYGFSEALTLAVLNLFSVPPHLKDMMLKSVILNLVTVIPEGGQEIPWGEKVIVSELNGSRGL